MDIVIIILGILYLVGFPVGTGLAICSIIEGILIIIHEYYNRKTIKSLTSLKLK